MKKHNGLRLLTLIVLLAAASASAQTNRFRMNIPFDFNLGNTSFAAGEYVVDKTNVSQLFVSSSMAPQRGAYMQYFSAESSEASSHTKLVFHRYGTTYFLYQVWVEGQRQGCELPLTRLEKEVASKDLAGNGLSTVELRVGPK